MSIYLALILFYIIPAVYITGSAFYNYIFEMHRWDKKFIGTVIFIIFCPILNVLLTGFLLGFPLWVWAVNKLR